MTTNDLRTALNSLPPSAQEAIKWIAENDDDSNMDVNEITEQITVCLVSDVFNLRQGYIAKLVIAVRQAREGKLSHV